MPESEIPTLLDDRQAGVETRPDLREAALLERIGSEDFGTPHPVPDLPEPYVALRRLGAGGMGEVWEGRHTGLGKPVAIKILLDREGASPEGRAEARERFARESRTAAAVRHENVVEISDIGETADGRPFQVMELLEGPNLAQLAAAEGRLPWPRVAAILSQLGDALAYAHRIGVVHRDLKPANVIVIGRRREADYCKLIDFGLAKRLELRDGSAEIGDLTESGQVFGSPSYMSPEQCRGEAIDGRSDVYSLGCVAFFLACGRKPFDGRTLGRLIYQQQFDRADPRPYLADAPWREPVAALIERAMDKDPEARFQTMDAFVDALAAIDSPGAGEAADARTPTIVPLEPTLERSFEPSRDLGEPPRERSSRLGWALGAVAVIALGVAAVVFGGSGPDEPSTRPGQEQSSATMGDPTPTEASAGAPAGASDLDPEPRPEPEPEPAHQPEPEPGAGAPIDAPDPDPSADRPRARDPEPVSKPKPKPKPKPEPDGNSSGSNEAASETKKAAPDGDDGHYKPDKPSDPFAQHGAG